MLAVMRCATPTTDILAELRRASWQVAQSLRNTRMDVLVLRSDRRLGPLGGSRFFHTLQIGVNQR
jgi:hypothetical protein